MFLDKKKLHNEIIVYMLNMPQTFPPRLEGIILCKSDGGDQFSSIPCAARVGFRYLGTSDELVEAGVAKAPELVDDALARSVPGYVKESDLDLEDQRTIFRRVRNLIAEDELPSALRMRLGG